MADYFAHNDDYFQYALCDPGYVGYEMFILRRFGQREFTDEAQMQSIDVYNRMHFLDSEFARSGVLEVRKGNGSDSRRSLTVQNLNFHLFFVPAVLILTSCTGVVWN
jgi:hypothetical protein